MDDNLLSQDDIDALMRQMTGELEERQDELENEPKARPFLRVIADNMASTLSILLSRNTEVTFDHLEPGSKIQSGTLSDHLLVRMHVSKDFEGLMSLVFSKPDTAMIADLMMMGDGTIAFQEDHRDALSEVINTVMGGVNTRLAEDHHTSQSISQAEILLMDPNMSPFAEKGSATAELTIRVEGMKEAKAQFLMDKELFESVKSRLSASSAPPAPAPSAAPSAPAPSNLTPPPPPPSPPVAQDASADSGGGNEPSRSAPRGVGGSVFASTGNRVLDLLLDVPLTITIELGRTRMSIRKILEMGPGSIVEMERMLGEPVDLLVNDKVVAKGEVVVVDENFGIRIISLVTPEERIKFLK